VGHGLGRTMHEAPEMPNFGKRGRGKKFLDGMVVATTKFKVVGDSLLLFHQSDDKGNGLAAFDKSEDQDEILERAQSQLLLIKF
ncbi:MAG: hypothetical protein AAF438_18935, partial [Pseudomonadota bacterium]